MKKYCIAIPQTISMQNDYENGWELDITVIENKKLILDDIFDVYIKNPDDIEYLNFHDDVYKELDGIGVWDTLNQISSGEYIEAYEEGDIKDMKELKGVYSYLQSLENESLSNSANKTVKGISDLIENALKKGVGVYFFF